MGEGRGNSALSVLMMLLILMFVVYCDIANANKFVVGDAGGWRFHVADWPEGKSFKSGDILVFNYNPLNHNVVVVDESGYKNCSVGNGREYRTGHDSITLTQGQTYFICSLPGHCEAAMKIAVNAIAA